jgi:LPXTG-motif cell wall-anchored protein
MKKIMKNVSKSLLAGMMVLAIAPRLVTTAFAEDNNTTTTTTTTTTTSTASPVTTTDTDPKDVTVDSDKLTVDPAGKQTEEKTSTVTTDGKADTDTVKDNNGNQANVVSGTDASTSAVTLDANGNPVDTKTSSTTTSDTASTTERTETGAVTTTTVTDTTVKTTETTTVDQAAIDAAGAEANTANSTAQKFDVKQTVEDVTFEMYACDKNGNKLDEMASDGLDHFEIDFIIGAKAEGSQTINISDGVLDTLNGYWKSFIQGYATNLYNSNPTKYGSVEAAVEYLYKNYGTSYMMSPGDTNTFVIKIVTADGVKHTYQYQDSSFILNTPNTAVTAETDSNAVGYDGKEIPEQYVAALSSAAPIQALFGVTSSSRVTLKNKLEIYQQLAAKGYTTDKYSNPLTAYLLDYYNASKTYQKKDGTKYTSFKDLLEECPSAVVNMQSGMHNAIYTVSQKQLDALMNNAAYKAVLEGKTTAVTKRADGSYDIQFKWPENELASASYNLFYQDLYEFTFGEEFTASDWTSAVNSAAALPYGLGNYSDQSSEMYSNVNSYLNEMGTLGNAEGENSSVSYTMRWGINGPYTTNSYQNYKLSFTNSIVMEQVDGSISVNKINTAGDAITDSQTGFNLYYISGDNANGQTMYYAVDEAGNAYFTTDLTKAALLMTVDGNLSVQYLLPNTYFLQEVIAPEGYYLNKTALSVEVQSGKIAEVNFTDVAPITNTTTETETTVVKTVTTSILTTPIVPDTPKEPETPVVPSTPEKPTTPVTEDKVTETVSRPATPNTGDQTNANMFAGVMSISVLLAAAALALRKKLYK